jgi:hypothetical protein
MLLLYHDTLAYGKLLDSIMKRESDFRRIIIAMINARLQIINTRAQTLKDEFFNRSLRGIASAIFYLAPF